MHYLAGVDLNDVMSHARLEAAQNCSDQIQAAANARQLGVKIIFVGLQDIHPPVKVAADYEKVVGAEQTKLADDPNAARADAIQTNALAGAQAFTTTNVAEAARQQTRSFGVRAGGAVHQPDSGVCRRAVGLPAARVFPDVRRARPANARKYILLVTNTQDVVIFNLEDKIREDLLNLNVNEQP